MSKKVKPFHQSIVVQLKVAEQKLSKNKNIGLFVRNFVTEVKTITETIIATEIQKDFLPELIVDLESFYEDFEDKYPRNEDACGAKRERDQIEEFFSRVISNLKDRL